MNKKALWNISYGVYIVSTWDVERPTGCVANSIMQITSEPATVAISINHDNFTNSCIKKTKKFAVSILSEKTDPSIIGTFGFNSGKEINKFDNTQYYLKDEMAIVNDCCAYFVCEVINQMETDTHTVFLGKVLNADITSNNNVMTYAFYHNVIKGSSPKNAPTYIQQETLERNVTNDNKVKYVCGFCGYEYVGETPFEQLPDGYTCPICEQPKFIFNKVQS